MDYLFWWKWATSQGPLGPVVLVLCGVIAAQARYIVRLHSERAARDREAALGLDGLMRLLMERYENGGKKSREAETRRIHPGEDRGGQEGNRDA